MSQYEVEFSANGVDGEGKPSVDIIKTPNVEDSNSKLKNLLQNPNISYNRNEHLRNGDKVEVTISLNKTQVNSKKIITKDEFKRNFTVKGLNKNSTEKETTVVIVATLVMKLVLNPIVELEKIVLWILQNFLRNR